MNFKSIFIIICLAIPINVKGESFNSGKTLENPLRVPEDVKDLRRFSLRMAARTMLLTDQEIILTSNRVYDDTTRTYGEAHEFYKKQKTDFIKIRRNELHGKVISDIQKEFDLRKKQQDEFDKLGKIDSDVIKSIISPVEHINFISADISSLIKDSPYDYEKNGFRMLTVFTPNNIVVINKVVPGKPTKNIPDWMHEYSHNFTGHLPVENKPRGFLPLPENIAEKWRKENGSLRCVYHYVCSADNYQMWLEPIKFTFETKYSGVIAEIPYSLIVANLQSENIELYQKSGNEISNTRGSRYIWILAFVFISFICWLIARNRIRSKLNPPPPLPR